MELRGGQEGRSDGQIIAPLAINLGSWNCSAGGDCYASREISEVLLSRETTALSSDSPIIHLCLCLEPQRLRGQSHPFLWQLGKLRSREGCGWLRDRQRAISLEGKYPDPQPRFVWVAPALVGYYLGDRLGWSAGCG